ncbi:AAA family ATPase [Sorangium sp. So ce1151]
MVADLVDFGIERSRHEHFFGREDALAAVDRHLEGAGASGRWVLVTGGPGMGKSAILSRWLDLEEQRGHRAPHHFLRRDVMDWDRPEAVVRSLSAQIEALYPAQKDPAARPENRLIELLARVSKHKLVPRGERLVLVVDGLDEARSEGAGQNPLPGFLPYALPSRVHALCASRPQYPHLAWLESRGNVRRIDLDAPEWAGSNEQACRAFWADQAPRFTPRLAPGLVEEAIARAQGDLLYAVKLREWLEEQPPERRRAERLPRGLSGFLEQIWQQLRSLPREQFGLVASGLGLICAAREALPLEEIEAAWGWNDVAAGEDFLRAARALLLEEPASWRGTRAYRPYHEAFRAFITEKLGPKRMAELHRRLLETMAGASSPPPTTARSRSGTLPAGSSSPPSKAPPRESIPSKKATPGRSLPARSAPMASASSPPPTIGRSRSGMRPQGNAWIQCAEAAHSSAWLYRNSSSAPATQTAISGISTSWPRHLTRKIYGRRRPSASSSATPTGTRPSATSWRPISPCSNARVSSRAGMTDASAPATSGPARSTGTSTRPR